MKAIKISAAVLFILSAFVTVDLGLNYLHSLNLAALDGITTRSLLHAVFRIFGDNGWTLQKFFSAFEISAWCTFALFAVNLGLGFWKGK